MSFVIMFYHKDKLESQQIESDIDKALDKVVEYDDLHVNNKAELLQVG